MVVGADNADANRFYERIGFALAGSTAVHDGEPSNVVGDVVPFLIAAGGGRRRVARSWPSRAGGSASWTGRAS